MGNASLLVLRVSPHFKSPGNASGAQFILVNHPHNLRVGKNNCNAGIEISVSRVKYSTFGLSEVGCILTVPSPQ